MRSVDRARDLRTEGTAAERLLWSHLKARQLGGWKFRRQQPLSGYIADFYCHEAGLVIELDGGQHGERSVEDRLRTLRIGRRGVQVLRFWNNEVLSHLEGVLTQILATAIKTRGIAAIKPKALGRRVHSDDVTPSPCPLPEGEGT